MPKSKVFLPLRFADNDTTQPLLAQLKNQMSPLCAQDGQAFTLEALSVLLHKMSGTDTSLGDHAIPDIGAYVEYMSSTVLSAEPNKSYRKAWRGVLAMVALSKLNNFNINIVARSLPGDTALTAKTPLNAVYKQEMKRLGLLDQSGKYYIVMRNEYPLAVLHPQILLCPFKRIDPRAVENVPWVSYDENGQWHWDEIAPCTAPGEPEQTGNPTQTEKLMLIAWLQEQNATATKLGVPLVSAALSSWAKELANGQPVLALSSFTSNTLQNCADVKGLQFGAVDASVLTVVPDFDISIDVPQLTDKLLFASADVTTLAGANGWDLRIDAGAPGGNVVVPPITADFAQLLTSYRKAADAAGTQPDLELKDLRVIRDDFPASGAVTVQIKVRNKKLEMVQTKTYRGQDLVYVNNFPYVCMWPYLYLAPGQWKDYYVDMVPVLRPAPKPTGSLCQEINAADGALSFAMPAKMIHEVKTRDKQGFTFKVLQSEDFPWFIPLSYTDSLGQQHQGGCLISRPNGNMLATGNGTATATIDFGTSNSVCAVRCGTQTFYNVLDGTKVQPITNIKPENEKVERAIAVDTFHRYYGVSTSVKNGKFASVTELYGGNDNQPIIDGQILLTESGIIDYFTAQDTNLQAIGIFSNLKRDTSIPNLDVNHAIEIFVTQLTLLCALVAKQNNCSSIQYCFSYPNEAYRTVLQGVWNTAISQVSSRGIFLEVSSQCITEFNAAAQYVLNTGGLLAAAIPQAGFAIVDIGGGTSDMTVWQNPTSDAKAPVQKLGSLSFQYAGNQIFSHSFFTYFKNNPAQLGSILPQIFGYKDLKDPMVPATATPAEKKQAMRDAKAKKAIKNYIEAIGQVNNVNDPAKFPALTALLNTLLEEPRINKVFWNSPNCDGLRAMVSFKLKGVLFVLANLIWECDGINTEVGPYRIYLVGGGSQAFNLPSDANETLFVQTAQHMLTILTGIEPGTRSEPFQIAKPKTPESDTELSKNEVVDGAMVCMCSAEQSLKDLLDSTARPRAKQAGGQPRADNAAVQNLMTKLETMYRLFVKYVVSEDDSLSDLLLAKLELPVDDAPSQAQQAVWNGFAGGALNVWNQVDQNLDKNISERTRLSAFAVRMAEELLNQKKDF